MKAPLIERVEVEIAAGRRWKARELLQGHIGHAWPGPIACERYGVLLAELEDRVEAGKFLFLSGVRRPEYEDDISLFLSRHGRSGPRNLAAQFPKSFRRQRFVDLPVQLQTELIALGVRNDLFGERRRECAAPPSRWTELLAGAAGVAIFVFLIVGIGVGFRQVVLWISALWR